MRNENPAESLKRILEQGKKIPGTNKCRKAWEQVLNARIDDGQDLYSRLGHVMDLPRQISHLLEVYAPAQMETAATWRAQVEAGFFHQTLAGAWSSFIDHIHPECINVLSLTAAVLQASTHAVAEDSEAVLDLARKLGELIREVRLHEQLDPSTKAYVLSGLKDLLDSLDRAGLVGVAPAAKEAEAMIGHMFRDSRFHAFLRDEDIGRRVADLLAATANLLTITIGVPALTASFAQLLH